MVFDVLIIGAGIIGAFTAYELSKYELSVCVAEKESDVASGASGANSGIIHAGYDAEPEKLKGTYDLEGNRIYREMAEELGIRLMIPGSLVIAFDERDACKLRELYDRGKQKGVEGLELVSGSEARRLEPFLSDKVLCALHAPYAGIVSPFEAALAAAETAVLNGVCLKTECRVIGMIREKDGNFSVSTETGVIRAKYIVNAAGLFADEIAAMAGDVSISVYPRRGEYMLLDKNQPVKISKIIFHAPSEMGKGILIAPTVEGNVLLGPTAENISDKSDDSTSRTGLENIVAGVRKAVPALDPRSVITSFAGLRAVSHTGDFVIRESVRVPGLIHAAGIESPGLTATPAIAAYIAKLLIKAGLSPERKKEIIRPDPLPDKLSEMAPEAIASAFLKDSRYGNVICRCEHVSEAEIVAAMRRPVPCRTIDGVKRRTRAGLGRCQGGFCAPKVIEIMSKELCILPEKITKTGKGSEILTGRTKQADYEEI